MKRTDVSLELVGSVDVPKSRTGSVDPVNDAIKIVQREKDTPYSRDADRFEYEAVDHGDRYRVLVKGLASSTAFSDREGRGREMAAQSVDRGTFESKNTLGYRTTDVRSIITNRLTVSDLRELGREHGVSYSRGSTKAEMINQLMEQAPELAKSFADK